MLISDLYHHAQAFKEHHVRTYHVHSLGKYIATSCWSDTLGHPAYTLLAGGTVAQNHDLHVLVAL